MGQKTNPIGFRLGISKQWNSRYYAGRELPALLREDELLRKYLKARLGHAAIANIVIERKPGKVVVTLHTGRPGVVIGKKGAEVDSSRRAHPDRRKSDQRQRSSVPSSTRSWWRITSPRSPSASRSAAR